jgi:hypothetical protein
MKKVLLLFAIFGLTLSLAAGQALAQASSSSSPAAKPAATAGAASSSTPAVSSAAKSATTPTAGPPPQKGMVWVNTDSGTYHKEGSRWYGNTKQGKYMTEADAQKAGYKPAKSGSN